MRIKDFFYLGFLLVCGLGSMLSVPFGKAVGIIGMIGVATFGLLLIFGRQEMSEDVKTLLGVVFADSVVGTKGSRPSFAQRTASLYPGFFLVFALGALLLPDTAFASGGITEFSGPLEQVMNTITGPVGKAVSIIGMALCGLILIFARSELSEGVKMLVGVVFAICFISGAANIVNFLFPFSGALVV
ncbi:MAG: TrbC/VirB2 family protein [Desulfovibrio sp.]|jgi:type IV secretion system protein VirB2|nr:TrbC/VirB2 family protein [Desulfovibrio sp.]